MEVNFQNTPRVGRDGGEQTERSEKRLGDQTQVSTEVTEENSPSYVVIGVTSLGWI